MSSFCLFWSQHTSNTQRCQLMSSNAKAASGTHDALKVRERPGSPTEQICAEHAPKASHVICEAICLATLLQPDKRSKRETLYTRGKAAGRYAKLLDGNLVDICSSWMEGGASQQPVFFIGLSRGRMTGAVRRTQRWLGSRVRLEGRLSLAGVADVAHFVEWQ